MTASGLSGQADRPTTSGWRYAGALLLGAGPACVLAQQVQLTPTGLPPAPAGYVDRVMDDAGPADDALGLKPSEYNAQGWPRSWRVDYSLYRARGTYGAGTGAGAGGFGNASSTHAIDLSAFIDTPNHGSMSIAASQVSQRFNSAGYLEAGNASTWRIDQRALPLDGGWYADHAAGDVSTSRTPLARGTGRISLPTAPIRGLAGQWRREDGAELNASAGNTGVFNGIDIAGFETSGGRVATAGAQWRLGSGQADLAGIATGAALPRQEVAVQLLDGRGVDNAGGFGFARQDTRAAWAATAWESAAPWAEGVAPGSLPVAERRGGLRVQLNALRSDGSLDGGATGLWADAAWRTERWRNTAGVFRFEPNLRWGTSLIASDLQGAYWLADTSTRQWQAGYSVELTDNVGGARSLAGSGLVTGTGTSTGKSAYLNANGRYSPDTRNTFGASLSVRAITSPGQAAQLSWDQRSDWGQTLWRAEVARALASRTTRLAIEQAWAVTYPATFSTSLARERLTGGLTPSDGWIWGVLGTYAFARQWSLDASVRGSRRSDGADSLNANVGLRWQPSAAWSLALRYTQSRGQEPLAPLVVSALTEATLPVLPLTQNNRSVQLLLRYEGRAGTSTAPLGGAAGTGSGSLAGTVYFDEDWSGRRGAAEAGVPAVTVVLDRRYVTRTDAQGRYEFPYVAAGDHSIEISPDNLPLPWFPAAREPQRLTVFVRTAATFDFPVQRER
ncbi:MAG: carboxypeptidase regulatory-like domain-containing protein [Comamonadaceae bacterium]|nr:MAG: carboxypeptidase regulatory-like domain-containing protein [Comamonadaceae bacterium]